jgi:CubicO group peptidase (beta-lactamase class C family)
MEDINMKSSKVLFIVLALTAFLHVSCLIEDPLKLSFKSYTPLNISDGWTVSNPSAENVDAEKLSAIYMDLHENDIWQIRSLLVFRNNKLLAESYMKDNNDRSSKEAIWSCTKQFTAILIGIAADQGLIDIDDHISDYLPQAVPHGKGQITIENLLTMKSGIDFNNDGFNGETSKLLREEPANSLNFILGLNMRNDPGTQFNYNDGDPQILSAIVQEKTGKTMERWAAEVLFNKIGITNLGWLPYKDGMTMGAFGILTSPREMAKLGQLVMNNGQWNSIPVVSAAWITEMTSIKVPMNETKENNITFGYYWWGDTGRNIVFMRGHGGQYVFINKSKNLIVVITAEPNTQGSSQLSLNQGLSIYDRINSIAY